MAPDTRPAGRFADCVSDALDQCRTALSGLQQPQSWTKRNAFGYTEAVSEADFAVERILTGALAALDPGLPVVAEEQRPGRPGRVPAQCAVIDPIDGTVPFLQGSPFYGITVCLIEEGRPACALVDLPAFGIRVQATPGFGLHADGDLARLPRLGRGSVLVSPAQLSRVRGAVQTAGFTAAEAIPTTSVKMTLVALGCAEAAVRVPAAAAPVAPWDYTAAALIVSEAAGTVLDDQGRNLAVTVPVPVSGWLACRRASLAGPLRQVMAQAMEGDDRGGG
jgi:fructose-1,6-bisphosphatase/inositol monophosphatase family enzyme